MGGVRTRPIRGMTISLTTRASRRMTWPWRIWRRRFRGSTPFSMPRSLAYTTGCSKELGGLVCINGHLLSKTNVEAERCERKIPVFVYHELGDEAIPWEKWAKDSYKRLEDAGADVRISTGEPEVEHQGDEYEERWVRKFLEEMMRPASVKAVGKRPAPKKGGKKTK